MLEKVNKDTRILPVLRNYTRAVFRYPWLLIGTIVGVMGIELSALVGPLFFKEFIDTLTEGQPSDEVVQALLLILVGYLGVMLTGWAFRRLQMHSILRIEANVPADLMRQAFKYLTGHAYEFFINNFAGSLTRKVNRYGRSFEQVIDGILLSIFPTALFAGGVVIILFTRNHWLGLGVLVWTILFVGLQILMTRWRYRYKLERAAADSKLTGALSDSIGNQSSVTFYAAEKHEQGIFGNIVEVWRSATRRSWDADMFNYAVQGLLSIVVELGLLVGAVFLWQEGHITIGDFVLIQVYILSLIERIWGIGSTIRRLYDSFADAYEMVEILETPHAVQDLPSTAKLSATSPNISFTGVSFWFDENRPILKDLSLSIAAREKVALVGPSGAGKSTITKLLLRLYDTKEGEIRIGDQSIREVTQESLRSAISFVPQEPALFHRTLKENIAYGRPDASFEEIIEAAKKAHCHEFIETLPEGYETYVGERGVKLSGGERQRVAIARAIVKDAPILVLDEATSSLDSESEALIQDALKVLMEGKTVVVIAHRLSTIMRMDRIVVIEDGEIAATGTHADLLNQEGGLYKKLWDIQAGSFLTQ